MPDTVADRPRGLVETHKGYNPRLLILYPLLAALLLTLAGGIAYQQLIRGQEYNEREKVQNQRRILVPGPRGNIYDREGRVLVGNRPRFAVTLYLDELRPEFRREYIKIRKAYREADDKNLPTSGQMQDIARFTVVQRYLDRINTMLGRNEKVDSRALARHYRQSLLLPYILVDDLQAEEYARLIEQLPVSSPLQVYTSTTRSYPYGSAAAHVLGYVSSNDEVDAGEDFPGADLTTFRMKGSIGRNGLEFRYDDLLQGEAGGSIHLVDPSGYRIDPPLEQRRPVQGENLVTSIDIDLQLAGEKVMQDTGMAGAAVAIDVNTGEVLALISKPDYDLNDFTPRLSQAAANDIAARGAWLNRAIQGVYAPGSTFKILTSIAGLRSGWLKPDSTYDCPGYFQVGGRRFPCHDGHAHGLIDLTTAIAKSCNVFFYKYGIDAGAETIAAEARRFGFAVPTGIELPHESRRMIVPDAAWKKEEFGQPWFPGDTANYSIGQGYLGVTPLQMASFTASVARGQTITHPTLIHRDDAPVQRTEPIGLSPQAYATLVNAMEEVTKTGTARLLQAPFMRIPDLRVAGKTGTAQKQTPKGTINFAWFTGFAPVERPQIAIAVVIEGDTPGEETAGGRYALPVAQAILKKWQEKRTAKKPAAAALNP